jgi:hypothetical protein
MLARQLEAMKVLGQAPPEKRIRHFGGIGGFSAGQSQFDAAQHAADLNAFRARQAAAASLLGQADPSKAARAQESSDFAAMQGAGPAAAQGQAALNQSFGIPPELLQALQRFLGVG